MSTSSSNRSERPSLALLVATLGHGDAKMDMENMYASTQEQQKLVASYEMRARPFSGLPGGFREALRASAG